MNHLGMSRQITFLKPIIHYQFLDEMTTICIIRSICTKYKFIELRDLKKSNLVDTHNLENSVLSMPQGTSC